MSAGGRLLSGIVGGVALAALIVVGIFLPRAAAAGWLIAFASVGAIPLGAAAWLFIHHLTGGGWGRAAGGALTTAATAIPLVLGFFVLLLVGAAAIYPWIAEPRAAGPGVAATYLNLSLFAARGIVFLVGSSVFAILAVRGRLSMLGAGLALVWHCVGMDLVAVDWLLSIEPRYTSSAFGAQIIVAQLIAAVAFAILFSDATEDDPAWNDLGSLLLATTLGETYLILMTYIVHWYGDLPDQANWFLKRSLHGWAALEIIGVIVGSAGPLIALLFNRVRAQRGNLRIVAAASLIGVTIEMVWLVAPATGGWSALTALLALIAAGGIAAGVAPTIHGKSSEEAGLGV